MGVLAECVSGCFEQVHFSKFQAFLQRGCTSFNLFLCNLGNSPHLIAPKDPFLLDALTYASASPQRSSFTCCWLFHLQAACTLCVTMPLCIHATLANDSLVTDKEVCVLCGWYTDVDFGLARAKHPSVVFCDWGAQQISHVWSKPLNVLWTFG